ncbi:hypothetical protein COF68_04930 [Bacillus toyonensis]|nr:hypothetical protein COF68_04930 [Bacillus toyonensis]
MHNLEDLPLVETVKLGYTETVFVQYVGDKEENYKFIVNDKRQIVDYISRTFNSEAYLVGTGREEKIVVVNYTDMKIRILN